MSDPQVRRGNPIAHTVNGQTKDAPDYRRQSAANITGGDPSRIPITFRLALGGCANATCAPAATIWQGNAALECLPPRPMHTP